MMDLPGIHAFLTRHRYGVLSSISAAGTPQSALVGIAVTPGLNLVFDTLTTTRKYTNLIAKPACSFVIGCPEQESEQQTVQLEGEAFIPHEAELKHFLEFYFAVWPDGIARSSWPGITHFVVRPHWLRYSDYDQSPPLLQEFTF